MLKPFTLDGSAYSPDDLTECGRLILANLIFTQSQIATRENMVALLTKAKNAYIADLKAEIIKNKTGVDLSSLFDEG